MTQPITREQALERLAAASLTLSGAHELTDAQLLRHESIGRRTLAFVRSTQPSITVDDSFGRPRAICRPEYVRRWRLRATDFFSILPYERALALTEEVEQAAGASFDRAYAAEQGED